MNTVAKNLFLSIALCAGALVESRASDVDQMTSNTSRLTLKVNKEFLGGEVRVYNGNHELVISQKMKKRKVLIDFGYAMVGGYTVQLMKGVQQKEFYFMKK